MLGTPVLNGLLGVPKAGKQVLDSEKSGLRPILSTIPTNSCPALLEEDIRSLPYFMEWRGMQIED